MKAALSGTVVAYGLSESAAAERLRDAIRGPRVDVTTSASIVTARILAEGSEAQARQRLEQTSEAIVRRWAPYAYGRDDQTLGEVVGALLAESRRTLATAESCTGGLLGTMIVDVPGSSTYYAGGWVTYSDALKQSCLGVPLSLLRRHGAVSGEVVGAMATGALVETGVDVSLAITGVAGPTGGSDAKPVGTVFIAMARRLADRIDVVTRQFAFPGDRAVIRDRAAKSALQVLRFALLDVPPDVPLLWELPPHG